MKVRIEIETKTFVRFWLVVIGFVLALGAIYIAREAIIAIGIAAFLAIALNPPVSKIAKSLPGNSRVGATAIAYVTVVAIIIGFIILIIPPIVQQSSRFIKTLPDTVNQFSTQTKVVDDAITKYGLEEQYKEAVETVQHEVSNSLSAAGKIVVGSVGSALNTVVVTIIVLVLTFLMLIEGPGWMNRVWRLYEDDKKLKRHRDLFKKMYKVVTGYVNGQVVVAGIAATVSLVGVLILSSLFPLPVNLAIPIAVVVFFTGMIPMFGATIGGTIATILLALNDFWAAAVFIVFFFVYQQIENNFISPVVQSKTVELSALSVLVAITIGLSLFGILGGLIAIPIAGCLRVLFLDHLERRQKISNAKKPAKIKTA